MSEADSKIKEINNLKKTIENINKEKEDKNILIKGKENEINNLQKNMMKK